MLRIRDVYPRSRILIFTHPGSRIQKQQQNREVKKKLDVKPFYVATKFNKIVNYFSFEVPKKKIWANFQRIIELFTKKIVNKLFKIWSWDPGSEIRKNPFRDPDPGVKKAPDPGSRIRIRNTDFYHCLPVLIYHKAEARATYNKKKEKNIDFRQNYFFFDELIRHPIDTE